MAKSDLLKEAIADAKAVKETALANAKIALEEAFAPRIQSMLSTKLAEDEMYEEEMGDTDAPVDEAEMDLEAELGDAGMDDLDAGMGDDLAQSVGVGVDLDNDGSYDIEGELGAGDGSEGDLDMGDDMGAEDGMDAEAEMIEDDLELESIIRELEEDLEEDVYTEDIDEEVVAEGGRGMMSDEDEDPTDDHSKDKDDKIEEDLNIDEIIESILSEEDIDEEVVAEAGRGMMNDEDEDSSDDHSNPKEGRGDKKVEEDLKEELTEAYQTIESLRDTINEVNLLNAKLLYTNKLFRNFELDENQKMKVIENFDRAGNTREVKLVFSTLAESFHVPLKKRVMVKESYASKPVETTAPSVKTKQIINEGNELANRWKKLAGLLD